MRVQISLILPLFSSLSISASAQSLGHQSPLASAPVHPGAVSDASWSPCGPQKPLFDCADFTVPLDYSDLSNTATISVAVTRLSAAGNDRKGGLFLVPGGPGLSGVLWVQTIGPGIWDVLEGKYDLIGMDPRGVVGTQPPVSCFQSKMDELVVRAKTLGFSLNLPVGIAHQKNKTALQSDLERQLDYLSAYAASIGAECARRTGPAIRYIDTQSVVNDLDFIAQKLYGTKEPINFWGFSYGAVIGQYLVSVLHPDRLGHIIIDGVPDAVAYVSDDINRIVDVGVEADPTFIQFVEACSATQNASICALASLSSAEIVSKIDELIDSAYFSPIPVLHHGVPDVITAREVRKYVFNALYIMAGWSKVASGLADAIFHGNFSAIAEATLPATSGEASNKVDSLGFVTYLVVCADASPFGPKRPRPTTKDIAQIVMHNLEDYSPRFSDQQHFFFTCQFFTEDMPSAHRYEGNFSLGTMLQNPVLLISNEFDSVSPLRQAGRVAHRLGPNARLIEQRGGYGHASHGQVTFRTAEMVRDYLLYDAAPGENYTIVHVDERPFTSFDDTSPSSAGRVLDQKDLALWNSWKAWSKATHALLGFE